MLWFPNALRRDESLRPKRVLPKFPLREALPFRNPLLRLTKPLPRRDETLFRPFNVCNELRPLPLRDVKPELRRVGLLRVVKPELRFPVERRLMFERFPKVDPLLPRLDRGVDRIPLRLELRGERPEMPLRFLLVERCVERPNCEPPRLIDERPNIELRCGLEPRLKDRDELPKEEPLRRDEPNPLRFDREMPLDRPLDIERPPLRLMERPPLDPPLRMELPPPPRPDRPLRWANASVVSAATSAVAKIAPAISIMRRRNRDWAELGFVLDGDMGGSLIAGRSLFLFHNRARDYGLIIGQNGPFVQNDDG